MLEVRWAHTKYPNTKATDMKREVVHIVGLSDGTQREILAPDPLEAMLKMDKILRKEVE